MSIDYSNPEIKHYRVCLNLFKSRPEAEKAIASIKRAELKSGLKILYLPYSILLSAEKYDKNNPYHFRVNDFYLAGAFKNSLTANIFRKSTEELHQNDIAKR